MRRRFAAAALAASALGALCACADGQESDSPLKSAAKALGFATDVGPPADFVAASRPKGEFDYIPVFAAPAEPPKPALDAKAQKAIAEELDAANRRDAALLGAAATPAKQKTRVKKPVKKPPVDDKTPQDGAQ